MTSKRSSNKEDLPCIVFDASVAINLLGTGQAETLLQCLQERAIMEERAVWEIHRDPFTGTSPSKVLDRLVEEGLLSVEQMSSGAFDVFLDLTGPANSLDDGEAATIAHSLSIRAVPVLDERKGRRISRAHGQQPLCTIELLRHGVEGQIGRKLLGDLVFAAMVNANMHVPPEHLDWVVNLLGQERAVKCPSIAKLIAKNCR